LKPGNVVVPTAVKSHIANATLSLCRGSLVRGSPASCFVSLLSSSWAIGYSLNPGQQKTRHIAVTGFSYLKPGDVVVPTAVESHVANAALFTVH